jgi:hypothetical protein
MEKRFKRHLIGLAILSDPIRDRLIELSVPFFPSPMGFEATGEHLESFVAKLVNTAQF